MRIQELTKVVTRPVEFLRVPNEFGDVPYKLQRLYIKFLDCKAQTPEGIFCNPGSRKWGPSLRQYYRRTISALLQAGWARPVISGEAGDIALRSYAYVWSDMRIEKSRLPKRARIFHHRAGSGTYYSYFKIPISRLGDSRSTYYGEIQDIIRKRIAKRKRAQIRWRLTESNSDTDRATFGAKRASLLFGYKSPSTGSKLRKRYFSVLPTSGKPYFNAVRGRWEEPCKEIAL